MTTWQKKRYFTNAACVWTAVKQYGLPDSCHKIYTFVQHIYNFSQSIHRLHVSALLGHHQALYMNRFLILVHFGIPNCYKGVIKLLCATWTTYKRKRPNLFITKSVRIGNPWYCEEGYPAYVPSTKLTAVNRRGRTQVTVWNDLTIWAG